MSPLWIPAAALAATRLHLLELALLGGALAWGFFLVRRVHQRSRDLLVELRDRRHAEAALRESEARYRLLTEQSHDLICEVGPDLRIRYANPATQELLGLSPALCIGKTAVELGVIHPEDVRKATRAFAATFGPSERCVFEFRVMDRQEQWRWFECAARRYEAPDGSPRIVAISRDITTQRQEEEHLRQRQKLESLGVLAGGIAHDFNNLLTAILGNLNLAQSRLSPEAPAMNHLDKVQRTVHKAADLCRQMLAYSGRGRFVVRPYNLNLVVEEMTHLLHVSISKKIALRFHLQAALPQIEADATQLQQVVMNLVTNAAEAIGPREGTIWIKTTTQELDEEYIATTFPSQPLDPGEHVILEVSDTGCGISPEVMARIFDPFFTTKINGRGLGLSAMVGILRGHRAGIKIYSEVGLGSTFKLFFPALPETFALPETNTAERVGPFSGRVLVVDDEPTVLESAVGMLETLGFEVSIASDGLEAVDMVRSNRGRFSLVLMDLTMPRMDGREAFAAIRRIEPDLPIVLSSGYTEQEAIQAFLGRGLAAFLPKPYTLKDLQKTIGRTLVPA